MKCTQCGCEKFVKTDSPFGVCGDAYATTRKTLTIYACFKCGHLEFFDTYTVDKYNRYKMIIESDTASLQTLRKQLAELENPDTKIELNNEIKEIEEKLKSLDITIREQQELTVKLHDLQVKARNLPNEIKKWKNEIQSKESHVRDAQRELEKIELIED